MQCLQTALFLLFLAGCTVGYRFMCPGPGYFPDPESCSAFYRCVNRSTAYRYICPLGTLYDPRVGFCNHAFLVPPCTIYVQPPSTFYPGPPSPPSPPRPPTSPSPPVTTTTAPATTQTTPATTTTPAVPDNSGSMSGVVDGSAGAGGNPVDGGSNSLDNSGSATDGGNEEEEEDENVGNLTDLNIPSMSPGPITPPTTPATSTTSTTPVAGGESTKPPSKFTLSPTSIYPCENPGYFLEASNCRQFYACKEISPGVLSAERIFRCPDRYLFDPVTRLCQRQEKVDCGATPAQDSLYYSLLNRFVVQLGEGDLSTFFSQPLNYQSTDSSFLHGSPGTFKLEHQARQPPVHQPYQLFPRFSAAYPRLPAAAHPETRISAGPYQQQRVVSRPYLPAHFYSHPVNWLHG